MFLVSTEEYAFPVDTFTEVGSQLEMLSSIDMFFHSEKWMVRKNNLLRLN